MTEAGTFTPAQILDALASLRRLNDEAAARHANTSSGPDMSRPTATAADFQALGNV